MKLLCLHVSEHRDESLVRPIWNQIFDESACAGYFLPLQILTIKPVLNEEDPSKAGDLIIARVVPLGKRFYPSESAFPLRKVPTTLRNSILIFLIKVSSRHCS